MLDPTKEPPLGTPVGQAIPILYDLHAGMIRGLAVFFSGTGSYSE